MINKAVSSNSSPVGVPHSPPPAPSPALAARSPAATASLRPHLGAAAPPAGRRPCRRLSAWLRRAKRAQSETRVQSVHLVLTVLSTSGKVCIGVIIFFKILAFRTIFKNIFRDSILLFPILICVTCLCRRNRSREYSYFLI